MINLRDTQKPHNNDVENILDEYQNKIKQLLENEKRKIIESAEMQSKQKIALAQTEAERIIESARKKAGDDSATIIAQAQRKADQIVLDATRKAEDDAKEKTRREVERIIFVTRDEAEKTIARTTEAAKKEADKIIIKAREEAIRQDKEADKIVSQATEMGKKEAEEIILKAKEEVSQLLKTAREEATREGKKEFLRIVDEAKQLSKEIMNSSRELATKQGKEKINDALLDVRQKLSNEISQLLKQVTQNTDTIIANVQIDTMDLGKEEPDTSNGQNQALDAGEADRDKNTLTDDILDNTLYQGLLSLRILSPVQSYQLRSLEKHLVQIPGIHIVSIGGSSAKNEYKTEIIIDVSAPLPMLRLLKDLPPVDDISSQNKKVIIIRLK